MTPCLSYIAMELHYINYSQCRMAYQQPGQPMYQQQVAQQGGAAYNPQQQVVAAAAAAAVQNPWGAAYNPYQQYATQVSY